MKRIILAAGLAGVGAVLAVGAAAAPAQAALPPSLGASATHGGACSGYANVSWNRAANQVTISDEAHSSYAFAGCRLQVTVTFSSGGYTVTQLVHAIPTACALTDVTCPSTVYENNWTQSGVVVPFAVPFIDHISAAISGR